MKTKNKLFLSLMIMIISVIAISCNKEGEKEDLLHGLSGKIAFLQVYRSPWEFQYSISILDKDRLTQVRSVYIGNFGGYNSLFQQQLSPDGTKIYFDVEGGAIMNSDGTNLNKLQRPLYNMDWSPDGSKILFMNSSALPDSIFIMNAALTNVQFLTNGTNPSWSPDGSKIYFTGEFNFTCDTLYFINLSDHLIQRLSVLKNASFQSWSPDKTRILFLQEKIYYTMNIDGTDQKRVGDLSLDNASFMCWVAGSSRLAFNLTGRGFCIMNTDGSGIITILENFYPECADWH